MNADRPGSGAGGPQGSDTERAPAPLHGVRVVDFTEYIAGPYGAMMLADMGADVVKVEPIDGDHWRRQAPVQENESRGFLGVNRGKRSIALDLRRPEGRAVAHRLIASADALMHNHRPRTAREVGIDYETVRALKPDIVYAELSAFGDHGPYSHRGGFDFLLQAACGVLAYENRIDSGLPQGVRTIAPADLTTGMFTAFAVASALYARAMTGRGEYIKTNLFASAIAMQYRPLLSIEQLDVSEREAAVEFYRATTREGTSYTDYVQLKQQAFGRTAVANYYRSYQTKDGMVAVACLSNGLRRKLRDAVGVHDPSIEGAIFDSTRFPPEEHERVRLEIEAVFQTMTTDEWLVRLDEAGVPAGPFRITEELYEDPHVRANDLIPEWEHETLGTLRSPRSPIRFENAQLGAVIAPPSLGGHTHEILADIGYGVTEIADLAREGVIVSQGEA